MKAAPRFARTPAATPWGWGAAGLLLGVLISLMLFAPARWLASGVRQASGAQVVLQDARGTLWAGSAALTLTGGAGSVDATTLPGRVHWQMRPTLEAGLAMHINADCCLAQPWRWHISPQWGGAQLTLSDAPSRWPAQVLAGLGTPWNTIEPQGRLSLQTQSLSLRWAQGRLQVAGSAQLDALEMSSRLSTLQPMGSYRLHLQGGAEPRLALSTLAGALQLSGQGQWVGGRLRFDGEASSSPESAAALANLLNIIGRRSGARAIIKVG